MKKGIFCISIDFELLWGRKDMLYSSFIPRVKKERKIVKKLIYLFQKYQIPATWAIVGKLYEDGNGLWSGKETIQMIKKNKSQEIASHSYAHPEFTKISRHEAEKEIKKSKAKSFVFPRNKIRYLEILKKYGFTSYRGKDQRSWELLFPASPPVYLPVLKEGLVNIRGSMYFTSARGLRKLIPRGLRFLKCKLGIDKAIKEKNVFHLWFHPVDFADDTEKLFKEFKEILKYASQKRKEGKLEIKTMKEVAKDYL